MGNPVVHFEILGRDTRALHAFYKGAFAWELGAPLPDLNDYVMVTPTGGGIPGGIGRGMDDYPGHVTFYVEVPNLDAALARIEELGGTTMVPPDAIPSGPRIAMFRDPEGHVVGLVQAAT